MCFANFGVYGFGATPAKTVASRLLKGENGCQVDLISD